MAAAQAETTSGDGKDTEKIVSEEVCLRDRKFSKDELAELEKKPWTEIKDLIFETDPQILEYL